MSDAILYAFNHGFLLGERQLSAAVVGVGLPCVATAVFLVTRRFKSAAGATCLAAISAAMIGALTVTVPSEIWETIYAAYGAAATPREQEVMAAELKRTWNPLFEEMRALDWYLLAKRWGVCHELWVQQDCTSAPAEREPTGIARELLTEIAGMRVW